MNTFPRPLRFSYSQPFVILGLCGSLVLFAESEPRVELLVKCQGGPSGDAARAADLAVGGTTLRRYEGIGWQLVRLPEGMNVAQGLTRYRQQPGVLTVESGRQLSKLRSPTASAPGEGVSMDSSAARQSVGPHAPPPNTVVPNDPRYRSQWNLEKIGMEEAWAIATGDTNVVVAVIDTGVNYRHPDLAANMWRNPGESGLDDQGRDKASNGLDDDGNGYADDVHGINAVSRTGDPMDIQNNFPSFGLYPHGTACAGVIAAVGNNGVGPAGVNWRASVMALVEGGGNGEYIDMTSAFVECLDYAIRMKRRGVNVRVASISHHDYVVSTVFEDAIRAAGEEGVLCVFAAGNDEAADLDTSLWRWSAHGGVNVLAVGGSTRTDELGERWNYGRSTVHLVAPSLEIPTLGLGGSFIPDFNGTSSACPHVAGAAALLCSAKPDISILELRRVLLGSVDPIPAAKGKIITGGRLNVARALRMLTEPSPSPIVVWSAPTGLRAPLNAPIEVIFSESMNRAAVEAAFEIEPAMEGTFEWTTDSRHLFFRHDKAFERTRHTLRIRATALDASGRQLDGNYDRVSVGSGDDDFVSSFDFSAPNDDFQDAVLLHGGQGSLSADNFHSNPEYRETSPEGLRYSDYGTSVWYRWVAPANGWFTFDLAASTTMDPVLVIHTGVGLGQLDEVASNIDYGTNQQSRVSFAAIQNREYSIAVASTWTTGFAGLTGPFTLRWYPTPPPGIDRFGPTTGQPGTRVTLNGTNLTGVTRVRFNGVEALFTLSTNLNSRDLRLTTVVPPAATSGPITIETPYGHFTTTTGFEVIRPDLPPNLTIQRLPSGLVQFTAPSWTNAFVLESTPSFALPVRWTPVWTNPANNVLRFDEPIPAPSVQRFYRAVGP